MAARSFSRGHVIIYDGSKWVYEDDGTDAMLVRACVRCNRLPTPDGHDACLGFVPAAISACCGHGVEPPYRIDDESGEA